MESTSIIISGTEEAIRVLQKWQAESSELRAVFGSACFLMAGRCTLFSVSDAAWVWCIGNEFGEEVRFDLTSARAIDLINCEKAPEGHGFSEPYDKVVAVSWADGTRLHLIHENRDLPTDTTV